MGRQATIAVLFGLAGLATGFGREIVLAALFGTSADLEVFRIAFGLPSVLADSAAVSLVSLMVPFLVGSEGSVSADRLARLVRTVICMGAMLAAVGIVTMPLQARLLAPGFEGAMRADLIRVGQICWAASLAVILSLPIRGLLSASGVVWPGAALQTMRSGGFLLALLCALASGATPLGALAVAALCSGVVVLASYATVAGKEGTAAIATASRSPRGADIGLVSAIASVLVTQILLSGGRLIDRAVASEFDQGAVAALEYSYGLLMAAAALLGTTASLFVAPHVTRALRSGGRLSPKMLHRVAAGLAATLVVGMALAALAAPLVRLVFGYGAFDAVAMAETARFFRIHALGLMPVVACLVLMQFVLSLGGHRIVMVIAIGKLAVKVAGLHAMLRLGLGREALTLSLIFAEAAAALAMTAWILRWRPASAIQPGH